MNVTPVIALLLLGIALIAIAGARIQGLSGTVQPWPYCAAGSLIWAEEFNGPSGRLPDPRKWRSDRPTRRTDPHPRWARVAGGTFHWARRGDGVYKVAARRRAAAPLSDAFHTYGVSWSPGRIAFTLDRRVYAWFTPASLPGGSPWSFDHPFFLVLSGAVGPR
jgi:Glycosyl hydrolases family 16